ncbi:MAG: flagellar basal body rod protein FlgB [Pseudomonadota bacterium]
MKLENAFGVHAQALLLRERRAEVLAANLANADTPGYKARDFDFEKILKQEYGPPLRLSQTAEAHIQPEAGLVPPSQMDYRVPNQASLDGNTVDPQIEYTNFSSNNQAYQASLNFLNGKIRTLRTALKGQ